jgi:two-component system, NtrC family, response regulator HydG
MNHGPPRSPVEEEQRTVPRPRFAPSLAVTSYVLNVTDGPDRGRSVVIDGSHASRVLIGTGPASDLKVSDAEVSRRHAALEIVGDRLQVQDLQSTNGTLINGVTITEAWVRGGETIRLGATAIEVVRGLPAAVEVPAATSFGRVLGASSEMRRLYPLCERLASAKVPIVIEGETGTGKEVLAEALHETGPRATGPFVVFDCTAVPANLVESELFGHARGAFTGAVTTRKGVFEQADGGTLLIDEIGDLDPLLQPKLLRAIERSEVRRVGGDQVIRVDVRIQCATRRDLDHEVQKGRFRDDLFHRLAVGRIELPPLRRRSGDIPLLARHFAREMGEPPDRLTGELLAQWNDYQWPGNVRELRNAVTRRLVLGDLTPTHEGASATSVPRVAPGMALGTYVETAFAAGWPFVRARDGLLDEFEQQYVERVLRAHRGNVTRAAAASGIARRQFHRLLARNRKERG